jgi:hypothetical protein
MTNLVMITDMCLAQPGFNATLPDNPLHPLLGASEIETIEHWRTPSGRAARLGDRDRGRADRRKQGARFLI